MILNFPFTKGGNEFCGRKWQYNDMNAGFSGLEEMGVDKSTIHPSTKTSPNFFGGNCDKVGWNKETGFGLVIGATPQGEGVFGMYIPRERLTPIGEDLIVKHYGIDAMGVEPEVVPDVGPTLSELKAKAREMGIPSRFINGASKAEIADRIAEAESGADLSAVKGELEVAPPIVKAYDEVASKAVSKSKRP